jgi:DNA-binding NarL/FixJ family response regulator
VTVRVVVADDHPVVRAGITTLLGIDPDVEVVGEAADGDEAVELASSLAPHVVLMDLQMPALDGVGATRKMQTVAPDVRVLILTTYDSDKAIVEAVEAGAAGYLLKDTEPDVLLAGIKAAAAGETVLAPEVAAKLMARMRAPKPPELTSRELDVIDRVARGGTNAAIAGDLSISEATVKTHLIHIFQKLGVEDRTAAVTRALELGLISL